MKEYKDYQNKLAEVENEEGRGGGQVEQHVPAAFLLLGAFISAGATYFLNEAGMKASPFYAKTIGAENAAYLVTGILEGSFLALTLWGHKILKARAQRQMGARAVLLLKVILSLNVLVAFIMLAGYQSKILPVVELYAQWGVPVTVVGAIWLWAFIVSNRRQTIMRNQMLDDAAEAERLWADQHKEDQRRYRTTYQTIAGSPEMQAVREEIAVAQAIDQIAQESGITLAEAEAIYNRTQARKRALPAGGSAYQLGSGEADRAQPDANQPRRIYRGGQLINGQDQDGGRSH